MRSHPKPEATTSADIQLRHGRLLRPVILGVAATCVLASGCSGSGETEASTSLPPISAQAELNWDNTSISLPLDKYAMSDQDERTVRAARQIVFGRCTSGATTAPAPSVELARKELTKPSESMRWTLGHWNAAYVSKQPAPPEEIPLGGESAPPAEKIEECVQEESYLQVQPITLTGDTDSEQATLLSELQAESSRQAQSDPRFQELVAKRSACIKEKGYETVSDELGSVDLPAESSDEEQLNAYVAEASCSDQVNFTQQGGDILATYQQLSIDANKHELDEIKKLVEERVTKAKAVLKEAGVS